MPKEPSPAGGRGQGEGGSNSPKARRGGANHPHPNPLPGGEGDTGRLSSYAIPLPKAAFEETSRLHAIPENVVSESNRGRPSPTSNLPRRHLDECRQLLRPPNYNLPVRNRPTAEGHGRSEGPEIVIPARRVPERASRLST